MVTSEQWDYEFILNLFASATFSIMIMYYFCNKKIKYIFSIVKKKICFKKSSLNSMHWDYTYHNRSLVYCIYYVCYCVFVSLHWEVFEGAFSFHVYIYSKHSTRQHSRHSENEWPTTEETLPKINIVTPPPHTKPAPFLEFPWPLQTPRLEMVTM